MTEAMSFRHEMPFIANEQDSLVCSSFCLKIVILIIITPVCNEPKDFISYEHIIERKIYNLYNLKDRYYKRNKVFGYAG